MSNPGMEIMIQEYRQTAIPVFRAWRIDENVFSETDLARMLDDDEFFSGNRQRLNDSLVIARKMAREGSENGRPWWDNGTTHPLPGASGLAAMYPQMEGSETVYSSPGQPPDLDVRNCGGEVKIRGTASGLSPEIMIGFGRNYENSILASQQLGIQKWGSISLEGSDLYLKKAMDVAVKHGTWPWIRNGELQPEIGSRVRNAINFRKIWKSVSDSSPDFGNDNGIVCEELLFRTTQHMISILNDEGVRKKFAYEESEDLKRLLGRIGRFDRENPGAFMNAIMNEKAAEGADFSSVMGRISQIAARYPEVMDEIRRMSANMAESMGLDGKIPDSPVVRTISLSLGAEPDQLPRKADEAAASLEKALGNGNLDESFRNALERTAVQARRLSGAQAGNLAALTRIMQELETDRENGSFSKNLQESRRRLLRNRMGAAWPDYAPGSLRKEIIEKDNAHAKRYERWQLEKRPDDLGSFMKDHDGMTADLGGMSFEWRRNDTAEGPAMFLMQNDGPDSRCVAVMYGDMIVSAYPRTRHDGTLEKIIRETLGPAREILPSGEEPRARSAQEMERQQGMDTRQTQNFSQEPAPETRPA